MIVVDTSALMAILLGESEAERCAEALAVNAPLILSAVNLAEALIVAARRNVRDEMTRLIDELGIEVIAVTSASAWRAAKAYDRWGKGVDRAGLNFGDCFAYELAITESCPLLFVGDDFTRTDVQISK